MSKVFAALTADADLQSARLRVGQVRTGTNFKVFLLSGAPRLDVDTLDLQVGEVAGTAFECAHGDIQRAEEVNGILPELFEPHFGFLGLTDDDHLLLLELMDAVNAALFESVRALFLAETGRIRGQGIGQLVLLDDRVDELADQGSPL